MNRLIILLVALLVTACTATKRNYDPYEFEQWLTKPFGDTATLESTNFYISNNPWSWGPEQAISVKSDRVYYAFLRSLPGPKYQIVGEILVFDSCRGLKEAADNFTAKLDQYERDPSLAKAEGNYWLDGPTYRIERFDFDGNRYFSGSGYAYGKSVSLGHDIIDIAEVCFDELNP